MNEMNENYSDEEERLRAALHAEAEKVTPSADALAQIRRRTARVAWWRRPIVVGGAVTAVATAAAVVIAINTLGTDQGDLSVSPADSPTDSESTVEDAPDATDDTDQDGDMALDAPEDQAQEESEEETAPGDGADTEADTQPPSDDTGGGDDSEDSSATEEDSAGPDEVYMAADGYALPVYYVVDGRITREWQRVNTPENALVTAVHQALNGPSFDPRYETPWAPVEVLSVEVVDDVIEVNLASPVELAAGAEDAELAVQQLVYTATATASHLIDGVDGALPVRVLVDGEPPENLFGRLDLSEPVTRDDQVDVRYLVQIDNPGYGSDVTSPVTVEGVAAVFEATAVWELRRDGEVIDSGNTMTEEAFVFSPYSIDLGDLEPGTYEITVSEDDASGGEGRDPYFETKQFTVAPTP
ncbi:Gmad2 immunoglobulin-like domain-containing protein [Phytoactinopolyspora halotolerans]|uniref:GerMN domain-containing protein n=1 Tax=Phytoactinopolyspora halotolerans TaxID=1981512 RepID=A0A6L9S5W3_9ACTN|nr:Gmad2 immunoglobulin-like domain-containing protein [Phytoactinopolyspora halotolerans]NED99891.1 hypothetical protein [Phytoactinopolyspora halotolerans]